jgi:hypothetical protein
VIRRPRGTLGHGLLLEQTTGRLKQTATTRQPCAAARRSDIANTYAVYLCKSGKVDEAVALEGIRNKLYREPGSSDQCRLVPAQ